MQSYLVMHRGINKARLKPIVGHCSLIDVCFPLGERVHNLKGRAKSSVKINWHETVILLVISK